MRVGASDTGRVTNTVRQRARTGTVLLAACVAVPILASTTKPAHEQEDARAAPRGLDLYMPVPDDNPLTAAKVALGRRLFVDRQLSHDRSTSCATCHDPRRAFTDGRAVARGVGGRMGRRNVPTIVNRGYGAAFAWDGRETTLEAQVLRPLSSPNELGSDPAVVVGRLSRSGTYRRDFASTFGRDVNVRDLGLALASYVRSVVSGDSAIDHYRNGGALSNEAELGFRVFVGKGNCWMCHSGPTFTDDQFHNTGVAWDGQRYLDEGRAIVTTKAADRGAFKTPTLREVARTAPYMHDGSLRRLEDVIDFYSRGGRRNPNLDVAIEPLQLTDQEKRGLVALLEAMSGAIRR